MNDRKFCMNSYLIYRYVYDREKCFDEKYPNSIVDLEFERRPVRNKNDLLDSLRSITKGYSVDGKAAIALSGGIDSAILVRFVPQGTKAYTFRCIVPGKKVIDETKLASKWAELNNLDHEIIDITWEDIEAVIDELMIHKGSPVHSIEAQIYIAAKRAKESGYNRLIFGENADIIYGGMDGLLKKDWYFGEFVDRYMYVNPYYVLREPEILIEPFRAFENDGHIDAYGFINKYFRQEALGTYTNACQTAGIDFVGPYSLTKLIDPIDYQRIRNGDTKYIVREVFRELYSDMDLPLKIPMPRPMNEWFADWNGPIREEFIPHCTDIMSGDQRWMIWCLERFLNLLEWRKETCTK